MNLVFLGFSPSAEMKKVLLANNFSLTVETSPKQDLTLNAAPDLFCVYIKKPKELEFVQALKSHYPQAWLVVVVDRTFLNHAESYSALLQCEQKDSVWIRSEWEQLLWLEIQRMTREQKTQRSLEESISQVRSLKQSSDELTQHSSRLLEQFTRNVSLAESIQRTLIPRVAPQISGVRISAKYLPAQGLGGDYYDIFEFGDKRRIGFLIADSQTHGMAAALLSILIKVRIEEMKERFANTHTFLDYLNQEFHGSDAPDVASLSLLYGVLDRAHLTFSYTAAGPIHPFMWRKGDAIPMPFNAQPMLGTRSGFHYREEILSLEPGDLLFLHTDGLQVPLQDAPSTIFSKIIKKVGETDPLKIENEILGYADRFTERQALSDDITFLQLHIDGRAMYIAQSS